MKSQLSFTKFVIFCLTITGSIILTSGQGNSLPAPKQEKLLNGLKILMWSRPEADNVTVKLRVHAGAAFDQQNKEGTMCLLSEAFFPNQDAREFFKDELGGSLKITCNYDYVEIEATSKP